MYIYIYIWPMMVASATRAASFAAAFGEQHTMT